MSSTRRRLQFLAVNDAALAQYGFSRDTFLSMCLTDIDAEGTAIETRASCVRRHRKADGSIIHAEIASHELLWGGRRAVAVAACDVTSRIAAEQAARDADQRLREAQQLAHLGSWRWNSQTDAVAWSDELFTIFGCDRNAGAPSFARQQELYPAADYRRLNAAIARTLETGEPYEQRIEILRPDGSRRVAVARGAILRGRDDLRIGLHGTVQDITDDVRKDALLRIADEKLRESETRYRELVENLDDVVFSVDPGGIIQYASSAVEQYGYAAEDVVGRPMSCVVHPDDVEGVLDSFRRVLAGSRHKHEFRVIHKDGRVRQVRSSHRAQFRDRRPVSVTGVLIDITEQRQTQEQLRSAGQMEAVGRLAGGVAHDFNNLLVAINGFAELALADVPEDSLLRTDLREIIKAGDRAAALTSQLLAFSRRQVLRPDSVSLNEVITSIAPMLRRVIGEDIELIVECDASLPYVRVDAGHLEQVIMNLVVNARDAMPEGGVLRISTSRDDFPATELTEGLTTDAIATISVSDTGQGMDEQTQAQIFEPFFTTKPRGQGTGLGLAMVYGFVKQSGGAISVRSTPGHGATFRIALPQEQRPSPRVVESAAGATGGSETILVTEDEETVRTLVRRLLEGSGYQVLTADGADMALDICRTYPGHIDLLLTDVVMPVTSGPVLAERAKAIRPDMAVLFMSGYCWSEVYSRGLVDESAQLLQKPFSAGGLGDAGRIALAARAA